MPTTSHTPHAVASWKFTDSPWFWVNILSTFALLALFVCDGKFRRRQDHAELQYMYGAKTLAKPPGADGPPGADQAPGKPTQAAKTPVVDLSGDRAPLTGGPQPQTHALLVSIMPLRVIAFVVMLISCVALQWQMIRHRRARKAALGT